MSSPLSVTALALEIKPSRWLARYVCGVFAAAHLILFTLPVSAWIVCTASVALLAAGVKTYRTRVSLCAPRAVVRINRHTDRTWQLQLRNGAQLDATLRHDSYLHPHLIVLNFKLTTGRRHSVVLCRDAADATALRHLRVALALESRIDVKRT